MVEVMNSSEEALCKKISQHTCVHCRSTFASKNRLFAHLRNSDCTAQAASEGLQVAARLEKVALIIGCSSTSANWQLLLWQAIDVARGVGVIPHRASYAEQGGAPGAFFAVEPSDMSGGARACDVLGFSTEILSSDEQRREWCEKANELLPADIRILGRSIGLSMDFHAERSCVRRNYNCVLPTEILLLGADAGRAAETEIAQAPDIDHTSVGLEVGEELPNPDTRRIDASIWRRQHSTRNREPGWGEGEDGEALLNQFHKLKEILRGLQGERRCHNFSNVSKLCPGDAAARRFVYKCRALYSIGCNVTGLSISVDTLLPEQMRAMAGLAVALQRGLVPEAYLEAAFSEDSLLPVPMIPDGVHYLSGCVYQKSFHHLLQPLMDSPDAQAWKMQVEQAVTARACGGIFQTWYRDELLPMVPTMLAAMAKDRIAPSLPLSSSTASACAGVYADVLRLLREAESSGKWPGISKGREKVIKDSTLAENGGSGGSFTVGSMPPPLEAPSGNVTFPELAFRAFELERMLMPDRPSSSTIAVNKKAQFVPHLDSGAGAGQHISLIVGLGEYSGGELVLEGDTHDIRYKPLEFNGWTQRHWTLPFEGERFSLVWFTPMGCENMPGLRVCAMNQTADSTASAREAPLTSTAGEERGEPPRFADAVQSSNLTEDVATMIRLRNGTMLPRLGLGTFQLSGTTAAPAMSAALDAGYRLFDTASGYKNDDAIGMAMHSWEAMQADTAELKRGILACVKCSPKDMGFEAAQHACKASLQRLGRKCLDLYLIHWPALPKRPHSSSEHRRARHETWRALELLYKSGVVRAIGVSNFSAEHLRQLLEDGVEEVPMVNQIEVHPLHVPADTLKFCAELGIAVQAYAPLGGGPASNAAKATGGEADGTRLLLGHTVVREISEQVGHTPAQVVLRWALQKDLAIIPRSSNPTRIIENAQIFDFSLSDAQMVQLDNLRNDADAQKFCWDSSTVS